MYSEGCWSSPAEKGKSESGMVAMTQEGQRGEGGEGACRPGEQILNVLGKGCVYYPPGSIRRGFHQVGAGIWPGSEAKRRTDGAGGWWGGARVEMCGFLFLSRLKENGWKGGGNWFKAVKH